MIVRIPYPAQPKARPRVTSRGTYMPKPYTVWKENVATVMGLRMKPLTGRVAVSMVFHSDYFTVSVNKTEKERFGRADIDNMIGGVLDALQDAGVIENDRDVVWVEGVFAQDG